MKVLFSTGIIISAILILGVTGMAECLQEPSDPIAFCITPEEPVAGQFAMFEISELASPLDALWDFGDGFKQRTLGTRFVEHKFASPGRYTVQVWFHHSDGSNDAATMRVVVHPDEPEFVPTPITDFDLDTNRRIDDVEFFAAVDMWMTHQIRDITFFEVMDAWINGSLVVEVRRVLASAITNTAYSVYDLNGQLVESYGCAMASARVMSQRLALKSIPVGTYVLLERDCVSGAMNSRLIAKN